jgi:hypothetical protein
MELATRIYSREQLVDVVTQAIKRTDAAIWERIKAEPDERQRWLAAADAFELAQDELNTQLQNLLNGAH